MKTRSLLPVIAMLLALFLFPVFTHSQEFPGFSKTPSGLFYKIYKISAETAKPQVGNFVEFDMVYHGLFRGKDSVFFDTRKGENPSPVKFFLPPSSFSGDLNEGITMLSAGDSGVFIVSADSLFFNTFKMKERPAGIDSNEYFYFHVQMHSFQTAEKMIFKEEEDLKKYLEVNKITERPNSMGLYIIESQKGEGMKIDTGCQIRMNYKVSLIDGKELFSSYERPEPIQFNFGQHVDTQGFEYAVSTLQKGSKAKFIVPSTLAFGRRGSGTIIPPYATIVYDVEIVDVKSKAKVEQEQTEMQKMEQMKSDSLEKAEPVLREQYLKDNNIQVKPQPSGLYYIPVVEGTGARAEAGKSVKVHYTGKLLNGKVFDSSLDRKLPIEFVLGKGQVIRGWEEGIGMMKQGGKATLIIPSIIGYGERDMGVIPPFSTLVFDVELVEVK